MKYAVYFIWKDGFEDAFNCANAKERDLNIKEMLFRGDFKYIAYERIYVSGEYRNRVVVLNER